MKRTAFSAVLVLAAAVGLGAWAKAAPPHQVYQAQLDTLNNSGVSGTATLELNGDQLTVHIAATGFEVDRPHPQHIHGHPDNKGNATCPPPEADANGDGVIDINEGLPYYGPVLLPLTPFSTTPTGTLDFTANYTVDIKSLGPLPNRAIVLHGLTVGGVYVASTPVACGQIRVTPGNN